MISIAMTTYNGEKYLRYQLDSIYNQTFRDFEVIVCDDCSTDSTVSILDEYKKSFGLSYFINNNRLGFVKNFEKVIGMCTGEYIALCDQDDIWLPEKLQVLLNNIADHSLCCSDAIIIDSNENIISDSVYSHSGIKFYKEEQFNYLIYANYVIGCTMLFKRDLLNYIIPFPINTTYHDWWIAIVASLKDEIIFLNKPLIKYRSHGDNQSPTAMSARYNTIVRKINEVLVNNQSGYYNMLIEWLSAVKLHPLIREAQENMISERIAFYNDMMSNNMHFHSCRIAFKNRRYMFAKRSKIMQILYAIASLFI